MAVMIEIEQPPLTRRQAELLEAIRAYTTKHGRPPTYRDLMGPMNVGNINAIESLVKILVRKKYLIKGDHTTRCLRLVDPNRGPETEAERIARLRCEAREASERYNKAMRLRSDGKGVKHGPG